MNRYRIITILLCSLLVPINGYAGYSWTDNTCNVTATENVVEISDVESCVSEAGAKTGEVVISLPTSTSTWTTGVSIDVSTWANVTKLTIQGAGKANTIIKDLIPLHPYNVALIKVLGLKNGVSLRITGLGLVADANTPTGVMGGLVLISAYSTTNFSKTVRIDNCDFYNSKGGRWINIFGVYGLIDSNTFTSEASGTNVVQGITLSGSTITSGDAGTAAWARAVNFGSSEAVYIEHNTFNFSSLQDGVYDAGSGARIVFRYNNVTGTNIGWHGRMSGGHHGTLFNEVYNNAFATNSGQTIYRALTFASGTGVVYNNVFGSGYAAGIQFYYPRSCADCLATGCLSTKGVGPLMWSAYAGNGITGDGTTYSTISNPSAEWGPYVTDYNWTEEGGLTGYHGWGRCNGTNALDGNEDSTGYPCASQPGMKGADFHTKEPVYVWNNYLNGTLNNGSIVEMGCTSPSTGDHIKKGRDYFDNGTTPKSGYTAYACPHPLTGLTGSCDTTSATMYGTTGYNVSSETDVTAPVPVIATSNSTITTNSLTVTGTSTDAVGVSGCKYRLGSAPDADNGAACTGTTSFSCSVTGFASGSNTLYVGCYDAAGNYGSDLIVVIFAPPTASGCSFSGGVMVR